jgi:hypothetical protein
MLVSPAGSIAADTRQPGRLGAAFPLPRRLEEAIYVVTTLSLKAEWRVPRAR